MMTRSRCVTWLMMVLALVLVYDATANPAEQGLLGETERVVEIRSEDFSSIGKYVEKLEESNEVTIEDNAVPLGFGNITELKDYATAIIEKGAIEYIDIGKSVEVVGCKHSTILVDNLNKYTDIQLAKPTNLYQAKLSPDKNKVYVDYLGDDAKGIITVSYKGGSAAVYKVEDAEIISLALGDGEYTFKLYTTIEGIKCAYRGEFVVMAENAMKETTYDLQSYYSNYEQDSQEFVHIVNSLWSKSSDVKEYIRKCYEYTTSYQYDHEKCDDLNNGKIIRYKPDVQETITSGKGICLDKASLMASLLRSKGISVRVVFGHYETMYHAWVEVKHNNEWLLYDPTIGNDYTSPDVGNYRIQRYN